MTHTSIVASTGPFVVTWNFVRVLKGLRNKYTIIKEETKDTLVETQFGFNDDEHILVTETKKLGVQRMNKRKMVKH